MIRTLVLAATFIILLSGSVHADLIPPDVYACNNLSTGDPCDNGAGVCQDSSCSHLDYAHWDHDASATPPTANYNCRRCVPKSAGTGTGADTATTTASGTDPGLGDKQNDKDSSGCSVGGARVIAPWLLAGVFAAGVFLLRRRPRR